MDTIYLKFLKNSVIQTGIIIILLITSFSLGFYANTLASSETNTFRFGKEVTVEGLVVDTEYTDKYTIVYFQSDTIPKNRTFIIDGIRSIDRNEYVIINATKIPGTYTYNVLSAKVIREK